MAQNGKEVRKSIAWLVLGPLLWNIMYDGLLRLKFPDHTKLVAFADDAPAVIVAKHLDEINMISDRAFAEIRDWINTVGLELADHKTGAVLITSRKVAESMMLEMGNHGITIYARLSSKHQVEHNVIEGVSAIGTALSRLMPNIGVLSSVVTSVFT